MSKSVDGFGLDVPPTSSQIITLAQLHRKQLEEAIHHNNIRLGDFGLAQKNRITQFTKDLSEQQQKEFYRIYNEELIRLSKNEKSVATHADEEHPKMIKMAIVIICMAALILAVIFLSHMR